MKIKHTTYGQNEVTEFENEQKIGVAYQEYRGTNK
jgi:hypothetical protein